MVMAILCKRAAAPGHACLRVPRSCKDVSNRQVDGQLKSGPVKEAPRDFLRAGGEEAEREIDGCTHPSGYLEASPPPAIGTGCLPTSTKLQPCSPLAAAPSSSTSREACPIATDCPHGSKLALEYALLHH